MATNLTISVIIEILDGAANVTREDMERAARTLKPRPEKAKSLGFVGDEAAQRVWTLGRVYDGREARLMHMADYEDSSEEEAQAHRDEAKRYDIMASLCREIFWVQARQEVGVQAWRSEHLQVCKDYELAGGGDSGRPGLGFLGGVMAGLKGPGE